MVCCSLPVCSRTLSTIFGWQWPTLIVTMPAKASRYRRPGLVPHVLHVAFDDHQRLAVVGDDAGREVLMPQGEDLVARRAGVGLGRMVDDRQRVVASAVAMAEVSAKGNLGPVRTFDSND